MFNKIILTLLIVFIAGTAFAKRIPTPPVLTYPLEEDQIRKLNVYLSDTWLLMNGRYNLDIDSTGRSTSDNGDIWIVTGATQGIQYRSGNFIFTVSPDS